MFTFFIIGGLKKGVQYLAEKGHQLAANIEFERKMERQTVRRKEELARFIHANRQRELQRMEDAKLKIEREEQGGDPTEVARLLSDAIRTRERPP